MTVSQYNIGLVVVIGVQSSVQSDTGEIVTLCPKLGGAGRRSQGGAMEIGVPSPWQHQRKVKNCLGTLLDRYKLLGVPSDMSDLPHH